MASTTTPNSFRDPLYASLDADIEQRLDLPTGLLASVRLNGERSNADQLSTAQARTVYQITPATRRAALDKWGVDAYLSPQNAAEVAGRLLQDSLKRNQGDPTAAVGEYHGGTDRANWGAKTRAYIERVVGALPSSAARQDATGAGAEVVGRPPISDRALIARAYQAYRSGRMDPEAAAQFEQDVASGEVELPLGASLKAKPPQSFKVPASVINAYASGKMDPDAARQFEEDARADPTILPDGVQLAPEHETQKKGLLERIEEAPAAIAESISGSKRTTPEVAAALKANRTIYDMPESNTLSWGLVKAAFGGLLAGSKERARIFSANMPGVTVREDEAGNHWLTSAVDGQDYVIPPGFRAQDIPRTVAGLAAFTPAGRAVTIPGAAAKATLTQAAIEGTQAATGGSFDPGAVAMAGVSGGAVPLVGGLLRYGGSKVGQVLARGRGAVETPSGPVMPPATIQAATRPVAQSAGETATTSAAETSPLRAAGSGVSTGAGTPASAVAPAAVEAAATAGQSPAVPLSAEQLGQATRKAALGGMGSSGATRVVAQEAAPDPAVIEAAKRLGIEDFLQPDHVTTNQAFRELSQVLKSVPGSTSGAAEREGLAQVAKRADDLITEIGGTHDMSTLSVGVRQQLQASHSKLKGEADKLYDDVRAAIPAQSPAPATNVLALIEQRAKDLGGSQFLSEMEKKVAGRLAPRPVSTTETVPGNPLMPGAQTATKRAVTNERQPTYALLDDVRRDLTAAKFQRTGAFKDADDRLVDMVESALRKDQEAAALRFGMADTWNLAQQTAGAYKSIQQDLTSLFGKHLDGTIVRDLSAGVGTLARGDTSRFVKLIGAIPESMRQEVVASGLASAFGKSARNGSINFGSYARWFEGLERNQQAFAALMSNLPKPARQGLRDLYVVSNSIAKATRERITTGRLTEGMRAIEKQLEQPDNLAARVYAAAAKSAGGVAAEAVTSTMGLPGAGAAAALASALRSGRKPGAFEAADKLLASPEFVRMARSATQAAQATSAKHLAASRSFQRLMSAIGGPRDQAGREHWISEAALTANSQASSDQR